MKLAWTLFTCFMPWSVVAALVWLAALVYTLMNPHGYLLVLVAVAGAVVAVNLWHSLGLARWAYVARKRYFDPETDPQSRSAIRMLFLAHGDDVYRSATELVAGLAHSNRRDAVSIAEALALRAAEPVVRVELPAPRVFAVVVRYPGHDWRPFGIAGRDFKGAVSHALVYCEPEATGLECWEVQGQSEGGEVAGE